MNAATHYWLNTAGAQPVEPAPADERCEKSDLPASMCAHCRGHDTPKAAYRPQHTPLGPWETATEPGECCRCGRAYRARATVREDRDDGGYIAYNCCRHRRPRRGRGKAK